MLHAIDFEGEIYMRQEGRGMLIGTYEKAGVPWSERETPWDFGHELLPPRPRPHRAAAWKSASGISRRWSAPASRRSSTAPSPSRPTAIRWSGRCAGWRNFWVACGVMAGFSQGGGVGLALANWMIAWRSRASTSGRWTSRASATGRRWRYTNAKVRENYSRRFRIRFPNEELPAARPLRTTPVYDG